MPRRENQFSVTLTEKQQKAVEAAFIGRPEETLPMAEKIRMLCAGGLALYQIEWPEEVQRGGKRAGAGRPAKK